MLVSSLDQSDGGPPPAVLHLADALVGQGHQVTILTHRHAGRVPHELTIEVQRNGTRIVWVRRGRATRFQFSPSLHRAARRLARDADVVACHGFYQWACVVAYLVTRGSRRVLMLQVHGVFEPYQERVSRPTKRLFQRLIGHRVLRATDVIVAASAAEVAGFRETLDNQMPPVLVAGLGVVGSERPDRDFARRSVLFLSRIAPKKRLDKLLVAVEILAAGRRPVALTVSGDGDDEYVDLLRGRVPVGLDVTFTGHVTGAARAEVEARQSLFCLPSDNENFGLVVAEAMAAGLPVITTTAAAASEHVARAGSGWVLDDPTPEQLADLIDAALRDPLELARCSERGFAYAASELTWDAVAQRWSGCADALRIRRDERHHRVTGVPR